MIGLFVVVFFSFDARFRVQVEFLLALLFHRQAEGTSQKQ
jgi:hypothetical protein